MNTKSKITLVTCCLSIAMLQSCKKNNRIEESTKNICYTAGVKEIGLSLDFNFERSTPDNFQVNISDNNSIFVLSEGQETIRHGGEQNICFFHNFSNFSKLAKSKEKLPEV